MEYGYEQFDAAKFRELAAGLRPVKHPDEQRRQVVWRHLIVDSSTWTNGPRVICSVLGELIAMVGEDPEVRERLVIAADMGMRLASAVYTHKATIQQLQARIAELEQAQATPPTPSE